MEDKLERYMDFTGAVPPCVTPARLEQLAARRRQRLQLRLLKRLRRAYEVSPKETQT